MLEIQSTVCFTVVNKLTKIQHSRSSRYYYLFINIYTIGMPTKCAHTLKEKSKCIHGKKSVLSWNICYKNLDACIYVVLYNIPVYVTVHLDFLWD